MNSLKAWINESVSMLQVHSLWTALLAKRVKGASYLFSSFLPSFNKKGLNMSTPHLKNGGQSGVQSIGSSATFCSSSFPLNRRHFTQFPTKLLPIMLYLTTQKPLLLTSLIVSPLPPWAVLWLHHLTIKAVVLLLLPIRREWMSLKRRFEFFLWLLIILLYPVRDQYCVFHFSSLVVFPSACGNFLAGQFPLNMLVLMPSDSFLLFLI